MSMVTDYTAFGPLYAIAQAIIESDKPVDAERTWRFVTKPRSRAAMWLFENVAPPTALARVRDTSVREQARGIVSHYNLEPEFYDLWLDKEYGFYSCADFEDESESLEEAQRRKAAALLALIKPHQSERILDLGCGWGAMMKAVFSATGDREGLIGYTLAPAQAKYIKDRYGLNVRVQSYISETYADSSYDKAYAIESWEHVPPENVPTTYARIFRALKPGGRFVLQVGCREGRSLPATFVPIQLIYPGFHLLSVSEQIGAAEEAGFVLKSSSHHDYRPTWKAWYRNLASNSDKAIRIVGLKEYNRFMLFCAMAWKFTDDGHADVYRLAFDKPNEIV
jgi:cyclopropane-fatty-acyl-phospholipid synthase